MAWPAPTARTLLVLHLAWGLPLAALAAWFGVVDPAPLDAGRCDGCGIGAGVIAAHALAAVWLGGVVAAAAAARRALGGGQRAPGRVTRGVLAALAAYGAAIIVWPDLSRPHFVGALLVSLLTFPAAGVWWALVPLAWRRGPAALERRSRHVLAGAWASLVVLLPALYAWVWVDRVDWLVF